MWLVKTIFFVTSLFFSFVFFASASWTNFMLANFSGDALGLVNSNGTIWNGSGDLILHPSKIFSNTSKEFINKSNPNNVIFLAKKISWKLSINKIDNDDFGLIVKLKHHLLNWTGNSQVKISKNFFEIPAGKVKLEELNLSDGNGVLAFFKPKFELNMKWNHFLFSKGVIVNTPFVMQIYLNNLETSVSPIKPLGSYKIILNKDNNDLKWSAHSVNGSSLAFDARGDYLKFLRGRGELRCLRYCEFMSSLLSAIGKKQGDNVYGFAFGN